MANLISKASGNFLTAATWNTAALGISASQLVYTNSQVVTTSTTYSTNIDITGSQEVDAVVLNISAMSATGTLSVILNDGTTDQRTTTVEVSALPDGQSWVCFKFGSPLTSAGLSTYRIGVWSSLSNTVAIFRSNIVNNFARVIRTTSTSAPASADHMWVVGEKTGGSAGNNFTVTMNSTSTATGYGRLEIGNGGTLAYGTAASTNYALNITDAPINIFAAGSMTIGTSASPIPLTSSAELFMNTVGLNPITIYKNGSFTSFGPAKTLQSVLTTNTSAGATTSTISGGTPTNWRVGDTVIFAPTHEVAAQDDAVTLTVAPTSSTITHGAVTFSHSGVGRTRGEIINVTQQVKIHAISQGPSVTRIDIKNGGSCHCNYTEFYFFGATIAFFLLPGTIAPVNISNCSFRDAKVVLGVSGETSGANVSNCVMYNITSIASFPGTSISGGHVVNNNVGIKFSASSFVLTDHTSTVTNNRVSGSSAAFIFQGIHGKAQHISNFSGNTCHSGGGGFMLNGIYEGSGTISNCSAWRNNGSGLYLPNISGASSGLTITNFNGFGNHNTGISIANSASNLKFINCNLDGDPQYPFPGIEVGITMGPGQFFDIIFENCSIGETNPLSGNAVGSANQLNVSNVYNNVGFRNCFFYQDPSALSVATNASVSRIFSQNHNRVANTFRTYLTTGVIREDPTFFNTATPAIRITPSVTGKKTQVSVARVAVNAGDSITFNASVRKSSSGDGAAYNGNAPRLIAKSNAGVGIDSDTVLSTDASVGSFSLMSGSISATRDGIIEFAVDCDGTVGWITIDDCFVS